MTSAFLNGNPATADDLRALALANYGHFTSMQVRDGAVQGRALHMRRLEDATFALFGARLDGADALQQAARALHGAGHGDASVRITVFSTRFDYRDPARGIVPDVPVKMTDAEAEKLKLEDLGTRKDSQYRVAESTLLKKVRSAGSTQTSYQPGSANLPAALSGAARP